jgi:hypothetical protein
MPRRVVPTLAPGIHGPYTVFSNQQIVIPRVVMDALGIEKGSSVYYLTREGIRAVRVIGSADVTDRLEKLLAQLGWPRDEGL